MEDNCIFCKIIRGDIPADIVEDTPHTLTILDRFPATRGHALVLLKTHREFFWECSEEETAQTANAVRRAVSAVRAAMNTDALNVVNNNGVAAGQRIPHVHFHVVPRYPDDKLKFDFDQKELSDEARAAIAVAIKKAYSKS